jgi:hypothetical protein
MDSTDADRARFLGTVGGLSLGSELARRWVYFFFGGTAGARVAAAGDLDLNAFLGAEGVSGGDLFTLREDGDLRARGERCSAFEEVLEHVGYWALGPGASALTGALRPSVHSHGRYTLLAEGRCRTGTGPSWATPEHAVPAGNQYRVLRRDEEAQL